MVLKLQKSVVLLILPNYRNLIRIVPWVFMISQAIVIHKPGKTDVFRESLHCHSCKVAMAGAAAGFVKSGIHNSYQLLCVKSLVIGARPVAWDFKCHHLEFLC